MVNVVEAANEGSIVKDMGDVTSGASYQIIAMGQANKAADDELLEIELRAALANEQLDVAYQPIVRNTDGHVMGVEALLRWTHPSRGPIPAIRMVRVAERSGLIVEIGAWVLERSCNDRVRWILNNPGEPLDVSVNVSVRQLTSPGFCASVAQVLTKTKMDPSALVLELTESIFISDSERVVAVLAELSGLGIRLALDDFGTGYSSLSYLGHLPIHIVKIDQGFIADIGDAPVRAIVSAVTNLAHVLGLTVIAEGVETQHASDEVRAIGCEYAQGYFYARPMPADEIGAQLAMASATN
jgi:EAL domain-containing protein (putative c-di-GMP-specific phosphodiesterase class I)